MKNLIATFVLTLFSAIGCAQNEKQAGFHDTRLVTLNGDSISLSEYVGKHDYVLVDFWASWCGPCMREMPNVKAAYAKYQSRGLEIVGISLDGERRAWQGAVTRLGMTWPQLTDVNTSGSKAANLYGVQYIPYTIIFDKKGNVVAKNLHGKEMLDKLEELMPAEK
ncbi:MAG: TlpA family protein disulfide reductase [Bacteroides sp.]|nr:TlpA family protein disulfide reductase [Bacteroides sp.]MCM1448269.1 TlpA family protein disulfide reductase [Bacteroides sp.]MCM1516063.1 TlpA family protein disulfide reductase [Paraprevotella sp.]